MQRLTCTRFRWISADQRWFRMLIITGIQIRYVGLIDIMHFRTAIILHN